MPLYLLADSVGAVQSSPIFFSVPCGAVVTHFTYSSTIITQRIATITTLNKWLCLKDYIYLHIPSAIIFFYEDMNF